jgi:uncharacterized damage-inducible protein DinB
MTKREILQEQFQAGYEESGWFVALKNALAGATAEQAVWKDPAFDHSVWDAVYHLTFWNERWLKRYRGETIEKAPDVIAETFQTPPNPTDAAWQATLYKLYGVMDGLKEALENISEEKLNELVSEKYGEPWSVPFAHINIHNAYHTGQIVVIRKLQGTWDASKGVS